jgi:hypothetical protein
MKQFLLAAIIGCTALMSGKTYHQQKKWQIIFDGKTTTGWHTYGKPNAGAAWNVQDKALHLQPQIEEGRGDLITDKEYSNFHLQCEWKISPEGNSGIIFLVNENPAKYSNTYSTGLEMQALDNMNADDNKKENYLAGALYDLIGTAANSRPKPIGEWNKAEIILNKSHLKLILNGTTVAETTLWTDEWNQLIAGSKFNGWLDFATFKTGHIALQDHGHEVWYRNIRIKEL